MRRKQREWSAIAADPQTPFMIGRLLGANEMAIVLLRHDGGEAGMKIADALDSISRYFMDDLPKETRTQP